MSSGWGFQVGQHLARNDKRFAHYWREGFTTSLCGQAQTPVAFLEPDEGARFKDDCRTCRYHLDRLLLDELDQR